MGKSKKKIKIVKNKKQHISPPQISITPTVIADYFNAAKIINTDERNREISNFLSKHEINSFDINTLKNFIMLASKYSQEFYSLNQESSAREMLLVQGLEKTTVFQTLIDHLLPLCVSSTDDLKLKLIQGNIACLTQILFDMVSAYHSGELEGEQFFSHYTQIKEKSEWHNNHIKIYLNAQIKHFKEKGIPEYSSELFNIVKQCGTLLFFYHSHPSFVTEKKRMLAILSEFSKELESYLVYGLDTIKRQQKIYKKNRQDVLESKATEINKIINEFSYVDALITHIKESPPLSNTILAWHSLLSKIHCVYSKLTQPEEKNEIPESVRPELIQEHMSFLEKINQDSNVEDLDKNITIINGLLDIFVHHSKIPLGLIINTQEKVLSFLNKNCPKKTGDIDNNAYFMYYASRELFVKIKELILSKRAKKTFDVKRFFDIAETIDSKERIDNLNVFFEESQNHKIDLNTLELILVETKKRSYPELDPLDMILYDLKTVNIWEAILTRLLPRCKDKDESLNAIIFNQYFSFLLSVLGDIIHHYLNNTTLEAHHYSQFLNSIKEKINWFTNDTEKYQLIQFDLIKSSKISFAELEGVWDKVNNLCFFYLEILAFISIHPLVAEKWDIAALEAQKFVSLLEIHINNTCRKKMGDALPTQELLSAIVNFISYYQKSEECIESTSNLIKTASDTYNLFCVKNFVTTNQPIETIEQSIERLSKHNTGNLEPSIQLLNDISIAMCSLQEYSKISDREKTKDIVTKHSSVCRIILSLIKKYPTLFQCNEIEFFIKKTYSYFLNEVSLKNKNKTPKEAIQSSTIAESNITLSEDNDNIEKSFSDLNISFALNEKKQPKKEQKTTIKKLNKLNQTEIDTIQRSNQLTIHEAIESHASEIKEIKRKKTEKIRQLEKEYSFEIEKINEQHHQKINALKQNHKIQKQLIKQRNKKSLAAHKKRLDERREQMRKEFTEEETRLNNEFNAEIKNLENKIKEITEANHSSLEMLSKKIDSDIKNASFRHNKKVFFLKQDHLKKIDAKLLENKACLEKTNIDLNNNLFIFEHEYKKRFQEKMDAIQFKHQQDIAIAKENYESLLNDLRQKLDTSIPIHLDQTSKQCDSVHNEINMLLFQLNSIMSNYGFSDFDQKIEKGSTQALETNDSGKNPPPALNLQLANKSVAHYPSICRLEIEPEIKFILSILTKSNIEFYIVGGWIRDQLLGRHTLNNDIDIAVNSNPKILLSILGDEVFHCQQKPQLLKLGRLEFWCEPWGNDLESALKQRDITVNALICDLDGHVRDPLNVINTFNSPFLTILGDEPSTRFERDPSLILRCFRFCALLNKGINYDVRSAIDKNLHLISRLPLGVYLSNMKKMFFSPSASDCFYFIFQNKLLPSVFPFLKETDTLEENSAIFNFFMHKIHESQLTPKKETDPFSFLALMMLIPFVQNHSFSDELDLIILQENIAEHLYIMGSIIIEECVKNHPILNTASIANKFKSYCLSEDGYIQEYISFYRENYMLQTTTPISVTDFEDQFLQLTTQYNDSRRNSSQEKNPEKPIHFKSHMKK